MEDEAELAIIGDDLYPDTELWRYMRLSTFLTLLGGSVFIPTIDTLRRGDPTEATRICRDTMERFQQLEPGDVAALTALATPEERNLIDFKDYGLPQQALFKIWKRELGRRRCVWCWHRSTGESKAMWDIYGYAGVAVRTTPAQMRKALKVYNVDSGILADVRYPELPESKSDHDLYLRPYLIKHSSYAHEREVRLVVPSEARENYDGHKLSIDADELIQEVRLSPHLPHDEALELRRTLLTIPIGSAGRDIARQNRLPISASQIHGLAEPFGGGKSMNELRLTGIANFGFNKMPFILSDDIRRALKPRPEWG